MASFRATFPILLLFCIHLLSCEILDETDETETCGDTVMEVMAEAFENVTSQVIVKLIFQLKN